MTTEGKNLTCFGSRQIGSRAFPAPSIAEPDRFSSSSQTLGFHLAFRTRARGRRASVSSAMRWHGRPMGSVQSTAVCLRPGARSMSSATLFSLVRPRRSSRDPGERHFAPARPSTDKNVDWQRRTRVLDRPRRSHRDFVGMNKRGNPRSNSRSSVWRVLDGTLELACHPNG
jgi:hypothetical protein